MTRAYVYEDGRPGRPRVPVDQNPPKDLSRLDALMPSLDSRGWYRELAKRWRREYLKANPPRRSEKGLPIRDPLEMDRVMCRTNVAEECKDKTDLEVARYNGRVILAIDPNCPNNRVFKKISRILDKARKRSSRRITTKHWAEHRILALYELKLMGFNVSQDRKQLAAWLFPEIRSQKSRGDKLDRAVQYLNHAISVLAALRAQSSR